MSRFKKLDEKVECLKERQNRYEDTVDNRFSECDVCGCVVFSYNAYSVETQDPENDIYGKKYYCKLHRPKKINKMKKEYYSISCLCLNCKNIFNVNIEKGKRIINSHNIFGQIYRSRIEGDNPCEDGFLCPNCECKTGVQNK